MMDKRCEMEQMDSVIVQYTVGMSTTSHSVCEWVSADIDTIWKEQKILLRE